jgi:parallel beta-helix repeat protein
VAKKGMNMAGRVNLAIRFVITFVWLFFSGATTAAEKHVPSQYPTIQSAIDAAVNGDFVIVAPGTYTGTGNRDIDFLGKAITVRSTNPNDPDIVAATIINCQGTSSSPHRGFYFHRSEAPPSILAGITIINGYAAASGGGIYCNSSNPTVINCTFSRNSASSAGGGMYNYSSSPIITNCIFSENSAYGGGGMYNELSSSLSVTNCTFSNNSAYLNGGGIYNYGSNPTLTNCTFSGNSTGNSGRGGGMYNDSGNPTLTNCTFTNNSAVDYGDGGGMYNENSSPTITNCIFIGNSAYFYGGGMYNYSGNPTLTNCTFTNNSVDDYGAGGGMYNENSSPTITNCIFSSNSAAGGGGMYNFYGSPTITNCTFSGNSALTYGGGMFNYTANPIVTNCILWDNTARYGSQIYNYSGSTATITFSDIQGGWAGTGNINANPLFVNASAGDLHLLYNSPCINIGNPDFVPEPNETDIDGEPRVMLNRVDMGADEFNPFEIDFNIINKRRIGRSLFEYDCEVSLTNISLFTVSSVALEIIKTSDNMVVIDPAVTFGDTEISPGESATSLDMCTFQIDRSQATDPAEIIWKSTCKVVGGASGVQDIASGIYFLNLAIFAGDINHNGKVDFEDLKVLIDQWLQPPGTPSADIAPLPTGDNIVNFLDFALLADNWLKGIGG